MNRERRRRELARAQYLLAAARQDRYGPRQTLVLPALFLFGHSFGFHLCKASQERRESLACLATKPADVVYRRFGSWMTIGTSASEVR
jgi:hypothetical protein